jgi:hypothetical protein
LVYQIYHGYYGATKNKNIFFYEIATGILDTDKFGLNTLSYDLISTEEIKTGVYKHQIKI